MRRAAARLGPAPSIALLACVSCASRFGAPDPVSDRAESVLDLWRLFIWASIAVGALVIGLIAWSVVRYRERRPGEPARFREHVPLEIVYTAIPVLIVTGLFVFTFGTERTVERMDAEPDVVVQVTAFDWSWRFAYQGTEVAVTGAPGHGPTMVLPLGRTVRLSMRSVDVIHAFYVPDLLFKRDVFPGRTTEFQFVPTRTGTFHGQCAEYCGLDHARMTFAVRVVPAAEFDAWLAERAASAGAA